MTKNNRSNDIPSAAPEAFDPNSWAARLSYFHGTGWPNNQAVRTQLVQALDECVTASNTLESIARWRHEDNPRSAAARTVISYRAILVGLLVLSAEGSPLTITALAELFENRLNGESRNRLDLPEELGADLSPTRRSARWLGSTSRAFHRLLDVIDPFPQPTFRPMSYSDISDVSAGHDEDREKTRKVRLDEFTQSFLNMTFAEQPADLTAPEQRIDIAITHRFIASGSKNGFTRRSLAAKVGEEADAPNQPDKRVVDIFAGWSPDYSSLRDEEIFPPRTPKMHWGRMATMAVRIDRDTVGEQRVPALIVGATLRIPMSDAAPAAVTVMQGAARTGLRPGIVHADRGYFSSSHVDKLHKPTYDLGFTPLTDYRRERLGVNGGGDGAFWVEGQAYCPEIPALLISATIDYREGSIDETTYAARVGARADYRMRAVGKPTKSGTIRMVCAAIRHPEEPITRTGEAVRHRSSSVSTREACARVPVSLNWDDALRNRQTFAYGSVKWREAYKHANRAAEAVNARLNRSVSPAPRGVLGFAAAQVLLTMNLTMYNLHQIASFAPSGTTGARRQHRG
jgi:hypothetical protein